VGQKSGCAGIPDCVSAAIRAARSQRETITCDGTFDIGRSFTGLIRFESKSRPAHGLATNCQHGFANALPLACAAGPGLIIC
jgi:hypothetical protein